MKVQVLAVSKNKGGFNVAHICCNGMYGDCLATEDVTGPGEYWLKSTLTVKEGRFNPLVRVEKMPCK